MVQKKIISVLGIWLMLSAILLRSAGAGTTNILLIGILSAIAGLTLTVKKTFEGWTGAVLGLWLIVSAFIPSIDTVPCKYCNSFIIGAIFIAIGFVKFKNEQDLMKPNEYKNKINTRE